MTVKRTLKLRVTGPPVEKEIEVVFPFARRHDMDSCTTYALVTAAGYAVSVTEYEDSEHSPQWQIAVEEYTPDEGFNSNLDYPLGRGRYACSLGDWHHKYQQALAAVQAAVVGD